MKNLIYYALIILVLQSCEQPQSLSAKPKIKETLHTNDSIVVQDKFIPDTIFTFEYVVKGDSLEREITFINATLDTVRYIEKDVYYVYKVTTKKPIFDAYIKMKAKSDRNSYNGVEVRYKGQLLFGHSSTCSNELEIKGQLRFVVIDYTNWLLKQNKVI